MLRRTPLKNKIFKQARSKIMQFYLKYVMYSIPYLKHLSSLSFKIKNNQILTNYLP